MKIKSFRIINYKSWEDSKEISLHSGINLIVGQNNAGKSAMLEALSLTKAGNPHKSLQTKLTSDSLVDTNSYLNLCFELDSNEVQRMALNIPDKFWVPLATEKMLLSDGMEVVMGKLNENQVISCNFMNSGLVNSELEMNWYTPARRFIECKVSQDGKKIVLKNPISHRQEQIGQNTFSNSIVEQARKRIYFFRAERFNLGQASISNNSILSPNSDNLAQVLNFLQTSNPVRFSKFVNLVSRVFPQIKSITVPPIGSGAHILIWNIDPSTERADLAIPLYESGTGVGQVLAMIYVIVSSEYSQCLLIDEPQSFLHPGAIRTLMEIFLMNPQHQYIITTHSPEIISMPTTQIIHIKYDGVTSKPDIIGELQGEEMRFILEDMGSKLSDVFGAEKILWVEGPTEEECFKLILRKLKKKPIWGLEILGVRNTGELESKQAEGVYDIYNKLSTGKSLIPPAVGFIFDREERSIVQQNDLIRKSQGKVWFLERRMYENYLLVPEAISSMINDIENFSEKEVSKDEIEEWLTKNSHGKAMINEPCTPFSDDWLKDVHGARILSNLFTKLSDGRVSYHKVRHGYKLSELIIEKSPNAFDSIIELIDKVVAE